MAKARKLPSKVAYQLNRENKGTDSGALLAHLMQQWGGPEQLAADMFAEFRHATEGSMPRSRLLDLIQRLIINNTNNQVGAVKKPSDLDDKDLEDTLLYYLGRMNGGESSPSLGQEAE